MHVDVALIRASYCDTHGNCTLEHEGTLADITPIAQAAYNCGGKVIVQVEKQNFVDYGALDTRLIQIPGIYVEAIVFAEPEHNKQTNGSYYNPAFSGEKRIPMSAVEPMKMSPRKVVARRCAMELKKDFVVNLGIGMPEGVASIVAEEGIEGMVLTTESGTIGGVPASGGDFGVTTNPDAILHQSFQFDFYDGGGLDIAFLGLAQCDSHGNINVSKFGPKIAGCGGFINITQNTPVVVYCGTFTTGGLKTHVEDGKLVIDQEGKVVKFLKDVEQITFSGEIANKTGQKVLYITERCVFQLTPEGLELTEVAPGVDIEKDILALMEFKPVIKDVKPMDARIFTDALMGLAE
jgi:propionate CoA-transferase